MKLLGMRAQPPGESGRLMRRQLTYCKIGRIGVVLPEYFHIVDPVQPLAGRQVSETVRYSSGYVTRARAKALPLSHRITDVNLRLNPNFSAASSNAAWVRKNWCLGFECGKKRTIISLPSTDPSLPS